MRKEPPFNNHPFSQKLEDLAVVAANLHDIHYSNLTSAQNKDLVVRSSFDGETFLNFK
jgi:hypothetical protein